MDGSRPGRALADVSLGCGCGIVGSGGVFLRFGSGGMQESVAGVGSIHAYVYLCRTKFREVLLGWVAFFSSVL